MDVNPYTSPTESTATEGKPLAGHLGFLAYGTACGLLASNIPVAFWSALNFMTPNRHLYIIFVTLAGGAIGAILAGILVARGSHTRIPTRYWIILLVAGLIWLVLFPAQFFGNRHERRGQAMPHRHELAEYAALALQDFRLCRYNCGVVASVHGMKPSVDGEA